MIWVYQFWLPAATWLKVRASGLTRLTPGISRRIASASSTDRVPALPQPVCTPPRETLPEKMRMTFWPRLAICASTWLFAPLVMPTAEMTALTPMMMPSIVSTVRILFRLSARKAILMGAKARISKLHRLLRHFQLSQLILGIEPVGDRRIGDHAAIAHNHVAFGVASD